MIEAASGTEGIRMACKHRPDVIFLDLGMADLSGFEVLERLKKEPSTAEIPVVVVTSRVLTGPEREEIMQRAVEIVGKGNLEKQISTKCPSRHQGKDSARNRAVGEPRETVVESILNVDDYSPGRYARTKVLQQAGFIVREASTGKEALQLAAAHNPSLILLDVNLPDMSGFDVCQLYRKDPEDQLDHGYTYLRYQHSTATAGGRAGLRRRQLLVEPVDPDVLIATVKAFLAGTRGRGGSVGAPMRNSNGLATGWRMI